MSAVTIDEAWPGFGSAFTVAELDRMPDDGHRYELTIVPANLTKGLSR
jgi:hypothetical protein